MLGYAIHKVVMLVLNIFWDELREKSVHVSVSECHQYVLVDFDALTACLNHIFSNTAKYILPRTPLHITFSSSNDYVNCRFEMISLAIKPDEETRIFENGYSGSEPKRLGRDGNGLGLWVVRSLLEPMGGSIVVDRDITPGDRKEKMGLSYKRNAFTISLRRGN
jgi:signal transduction histidine kinase